MNKPYICPKCNHNEYEQDLISTSSKGISRFFNVENKRFVAITCTNCQYTEFYKTKASAISQIVDFFGN